jgi:hypothetical protein
MEAWTHFAGKRLMYAEWLKGVFTRNTIFVSHRVIQQRPTKLGSILILLDAVIRHGATQK